MRAFAPATGKFQRHGTVPGPQDTTYNYEASGELQKHNGKEKLTDLYMNPSAAIMRLTIERQSTPAENELGSFLSSQALPT